MMGCTSYAAKATVLALEFGAQGEILSAPFTLQRHHFCLSR
jgi:hypothetical protein